MPSIKVKNYLLSIPVEFECNDSSLVTIVHSGE
jgi:hypothetical protein